MSISTPWRMGTSPKFFLTDAIVTLAMYGFPATGISVSKYHTVMVISILCFTPI
jgi:hypothetical protein